MHDSSIYLSLHLDKWVNEIKLNLHHRRNNVNKQFSFLLRHRFFLNYFPIKTHKRYFLEKDTTTSMILSIYNLSNTCVKIPIMSR